MTSMTLPGALEILFVGIVATAVLDLWALGLNRSFGLPLTNWGHVGRWVSRIPQGQFRNSSIATVHPIAHEGAIGWTTHYLIGVAYAAAYLAGIAAISREPGPGSAALFGLLTVFAPWLILQPGIGLGLFASNAPRPARTRALNLLSHLVFGLGLYVGWSVTNAGA